MISTLGPVFGELGPILRTLWVCDVAGGPQQYAATEPRSTPLGLEEAHRELKISPVEFDEVAADLGRTLPEPRGRSRWRPTSARVDSSAQPEAISSS
jgi:hypothetical protein